MALSDYLERRLKTQSENAESAEDIETHLGCAGASLSTEDATATTQHAENHETDLAAARNETKPQVQTSETVSDSGSASDSGSDSGSDSDSDSGSDSGSGSDSSSNSDSGSTNTTTSASTPSSDTASDSSSATDATTQNGTSDDSPAEGDTYAAFLAKEDKKAQKKAAKQEKQEKQAAKQAKQGKHAAGTYNPPTITDAENTLAIPHKKKHPALKGIGIAACAIVVLAAVVYGAGVLVFNNRMLPHTTIVDQDISLNSNDQVIQLLQSISDNYSIEAKCGSFSFKLTQADLNLTLNTAQLIDDIHALYNPLKWPLYLIEPAHDVSDALDVRFDPARYQEQFIAAINEFNTTETPPVNAYIYYNETSNKFLVQNEVEGTQLDPAHSLETFADGIDHLQPVVRLTEEDLIQPTARGNDERLVESARLATGLISSRITLTVDGNPVRELTSDELAAAIAINENFEVAFNDEYLNGFCHALAESFSTLGSERSYTRADGKVITVSGGDTGWQVEAEQFNAALLDAIKRAEATSIEIPFVQRGPVFAERGGRDWPNRYIDVDLSEQYVRYYDENGSLFWETACITGRPDGVHNTPQGVWSVNTIKSPSKLVGYEYGRKIYETSVTFWMPFVDNSIGFHDATWQPRFGGSMYANGYGSHGCVNLSYSAARELYNMIRVGDVVVTHY